MNAITQPFRALVQRKLWPVALLLVGALAAVPMLLSKEPVTTPAPAPHAKAADGMPATFVSAVETSDDGARRRVLGKSKDPFEPAPLSKEAKAARKKAAEAAKKAAKAAKAAQGDAGTKPSSGAGGAVAVPGSGSGSYGGGVPTVPSAPPVSAAPTPAPTYPLYSIKVRFGKTDGAKSTKTLERLSVLPSTASPLLVYRGVEDGGKVAVFELTGSVDALGDGKCEPGDGECTVLKLRAGETEFLTISDTGTEADAQYQLELLKIHTQATTSKAEADKASEALKRFLHRASLK